MGYLDIAVPALRAKFGRAPFIIQHRLAPHRLFALPRLVELARSLPDSKVEWNSGNVPVSLDPGETPRNGLSPEETIRRIQECSSWLVLKNAERDPEYAELLDRCLGEVERAAPDLTAGMHGFESFIFVSSPNAVTPYHMDPEENFLLQIRGRKTLHAFERSVLSDQEAERFFSGAHRNLVYRDEYAARSRAFKLAPGLALHLPVIVPHWVQKHTAKRFAPGRSKRRISDSPASHVNWLCGRKIFAACALPEALRQRLQWQYRKPDKGGLILKRTEPHRQLPAIDSCSIPIPLSQQRTTLV